MAWMETTTTTTTSMSKLFETWIMGKTKGNKRTEKNWKFTSVKIFSCVRCRKTELIYVDLFFFQKKERRHENATKSNK